jgi:hypothetical protein
MAHGQRRSYAILCRRFSHAEESKILIRRSRPRGTRGLPITAIFLSRGLSFVCARRMYFPSGNESTHISLTSYDFWGTYKLSKPELSNRFLQYLDEWCHICVRANELQGTLGSGFEQVMLSSSYDRHTYNHATLLRFLYSAQTHGGSVSFPSHLALRVDSSQPRTSMLLIFPLSLVKMSTQLLNTTHALQGPDLSCHQLLYTSHVFSDWYHS